MPLTPDLVDDYFLLFDNAFPDNPDWAGCFCAFYDDPGSDEEWDPSNPAFAARNRANRAATIAAGNAHGLLAFDSGVPIGWVNAGPRDSYRNLRVYAEAIEPGETGIGCVMCFVIHPDHRKRGIGTALLAEVDDYFRSLELSTAEGYPRKKPPQDPHFPWTAAYYKGSPDMYRSAGYLTHRDHDYFVAVRKVL